MACYSQEGILDIKRNTEHEIWSNVEPTTLVEGKWDEASRFTASFWTAFCGWVVVQAMFKGPKMGCGAVWKMLYVSNQKFYDKASRRSLRNYEVWNWCNVLSVLGQWQCRPAVLSKNTIFMILKRPTSISLHLLAKTIMKNTEHETEQPLSKSHFGLIFQGCWVQVASMDFSGPILVCIILGVSSIHGCIFCH